jgi:hypothetical protein
MRTSILIEARVTPQHNSMSHTTSVVTISDELSGEVAAAILTRQSELKRDPRELLDIVMTVYDTLQELSAKARERRGKRGIVSGRDS